MSAAELRKAAETLRGLAEAVEARESWSFSPGRDGMVGDPASAALLAFINTMSPGVGLALADWLDTAGADLWAYGPLCECGSGCNDCDDSLWEPHVRRALAVARLINGGAS